MSRIDRNDEWKVLVERPDLPFVLLGGPVGFGKSYLLNEAKARLSPSWGIVELPFQQRFGPTGRSVSRRDILNHIWPQVASTSTPLSPSDPTAVGQLLGQVVRINRPLVLILDDVDRITDSDVAFWLRDSVVYPIFDHRHNRGLETRCFVTGRQLSTSDQLLIRCWRDLAGTYQGKPRFPRIAYLGPFCYKDIYTTLGDQVTTRAENQADEWSPLSNTERADVARQVRQLSGGHPLVVDTMLAEIGRDHDYRPDSDYFGPVSFQALAWPACQDILRFIDDVAGDLDRRVRDCFLNLSVWRCYDAEIVETVWTYTLRDAPPEADIYDQVQKRLEDNGLIAHDDGKPTLFTGNVYHSILERSLRLEAPDTWLAIHILALQYFRHALSQNGPPPCLGRDAALIQEIFYHHSVILAYLRPASGPIQLRQQLQRQIEDLTARHRRLTRRRTLEQEVGDLLASLRQDEEIRLTFMEWAGEAALDTLIDEVAAACQLPGDEDTG